MWPRMHSSGWMMCCFKMSNSVYVTRSHFYRGAAFVKVSVKVSVNVAQYRHLVKVLVKVVFTLVFCARSAQGTKW